MEKNPNAEPDLPQSDQLPGPLAQSPGSTGSPERLSASDLPVIAKSIPSTLLNSRRGILEAEKVEVASYGGHAAWLQAKARALLPLFPSGLSPDVFERDTLIYWIEGARRMEQCRRCPPYGGECENSHFWCPDGHHIIPDAEKGIGSDYCQKWPIWQIRELLLRLNVPPHLTEPDFTLIPESVQQEIHHARRDRQPRWFFVTGGDPRRHDLLLVPMLYELAHISGRTSWFDVSASVFRKILGHREDPTSPDPLDRIRDTHTLALMLVSPQTWKDWYVEAIDEALYARSGKTTVIASAKSAEELSEILPLSSALLTNAIQVELA